MLRDGDPSHELTPKANRTKRNRDCIPPLVCVTRVSRRIPPIGGYRALPARANAQVRPVAFDHVRRSQIRPKRFRKLQAASRRGVVKQTAAGDDAPRER
jgi:hypothetical protein